MMNSQFFNNAALGRYLHCFFGTLLLIGIVLLIIWMAKNLKKQDLLTWIIILLVAGAVGSVLTMNSGRWGWRSMMNYDGSFDKVGNWNVK